MSFVGVVVLLLVVSYVAKACYDSRLPATNNVMSLGHAHYGGGPVPPGHAGTTGTTGNGPIGGGVDDAPSHDAVRVGTELRDKPE